MNVNLDSNIDTIILHIGVNDILQDSTPDNVINYIKNMELMVQKCHAFRVKWALLHRIVYTKIISLNIIEDIHNRLENLDIPYVDNRNIHGLHFFKDGLHLMESGKKNIFQQLDILFEQF